MSSSRPSPARVTPRLSGEEWQAAAAPVVWGNLDFILPRLKGIPHGKILVNYVTSQRVPGREAQGGRERCLDPRTPRSGSETRQPGPCAANFTFVPFASSAFADSASGEKKKKIFPFKTMVHKRSVKQHSL